MFQRIKNRAAFRSLIGVMLIKFATGAISSWGSVNLYILSYFYHEGVHLGSQTNSIIILFTIIPISFLVMFSTKLSDKFGYENIIIICSLIFVLSPMVIIFKFNFTTMVLCCLFLPASGFSISTIPVINCLWTQFPK
jgi:MFS family permease